MSSAMKCFCVLLVSTSSSSALFYTHTAAVDYAKQFYLNYNPAYGDIEKYQCIDCSDFVSQCIIAALGEPIAHGPRMSADEWEAFQGTHKEARYWFDENGTLPWAPHLRNFLRDEWGLRDAPYHFIWQPGQRPQTPQGLPLQPGDIAFYGTPSCGTKHAMMIIGVDNNKITYAGHCTDRVNGNLLRWNTKAKLEVFHIPDVIRNCGRLRYIYTTDSTFVPTWHVRHQWHCCWHENLGGTSPWTDNPTAYPCLSWSETNGTTWDTLISPRMNLASCSAAVFRQRSISILQHGSNKTIQIRGSTDDGATWSYLLGSDSLTEASFSWATNQRPQESA